LSICILIFGFKKCQRVLPVDGFILLHFYTRCWSNVFVRSPVFFKTFSSEAARKLESGSHAKVLMASRANCFRWSYQQIICRIAEAMQRDNGDSQEQNQSPAKFLRVIQLPSGCGETATHARAAQ
jgi:hypothetical protein